jgi:hypothetical protein
MDEQAIGTNSVSYSSRYPSQSMTGSIVRSAYDDGVASSGFVISQTSAATLQSSVNSPFDRDSPTWGSDQWSTSTMRPVEEPCNNDQSSSSRLQKSARSQSAHHGVGHAKFSPKDHSNEQSLLDMDEPMSGVEDITLLMTAQHELDQQPLNKFNEGEVGGRGTRLVVQNPNLSSRHGGLSQSIHNPATNHGDQDAWYGVSI